MGFLAGKLYLIVGVASDRSIATGIAEAMHREGAELAFTYQNDKLKSRVLKAAERYGSSEAMCFPCDVTSDEAIDAVFAELGEQWDGLDGIVHAVGFAPAAELDGNFVDVATREGFQIAHDISSYSFVALAKAGKSMLAGRNGALLTLTYHAARQSVPNYNVMGMAKASLEASVRYLAASMGPDGIRVNGILPAPFAPWRPPVSRSSAACWTTMPPRRLCAVTSPSRKWAILRPSCARTWPPALPARSPM